MIIKQLRLRHFGPYYGDHLLDLRVTRDAPLILIYGENTWGKTSLLNAVRWCLYGRARGREGRQKPTWRLINTDAIRDSEQTMSVSLEFEHDGVQFTLERTATWSTAPKGDEHVEVAPYLRQNGQPVAAGSVEGRIGGILNEDISRFFLFDAEMLGEYEMLLEQPSKAVTDMRREIESVLGLPALRLAKEDLEDLHGAAQKQLQRTVKKAEQAKALVAQAEQLEDEIKAKRTDQTALTSRLSHNEAKRDHLLDARARFSDLEEAVREMEHTETSMRENRGVADEVERQMRELVERTWWLALLPRLVKRAADLAEQVEERSATSRERIELLTERAGVKAAFAERLCGRCGQALSDESRDRLRAREIAIEAKLAALGPDETYSNAAYELRQLQPRIGGYSIEPLKLKNADLRRLRLQYRDLHRRREQLSESLQNHDREELRKIEVDLEHLIVLIAQLRTEVADLGADLKRLEDALARIRKDIQKLPGADKALVTEASLLSALRSLFDASIAKFREQMRVDVALEATAIFRRLTTEPKYRNLHINENYGLVIEDDEGRQIRDRSAGAEQVVAMSLVGGLNRCTRREAPMLIDTPLGRLDRGHRKNIIAFLPELSKQVIVLPHSGELNREQDLESVRSKISREYLIVRDGLRSSFREVG